MKKLFAILAAISLTFSGAVAANAADAYNPDVRMTQGLDATFVIGEEGSVDTYSLLHGNKGNGQVRAQFTCKSVYDSACADADSFQAYSILGVCKTATDENCIVKLELSAGPEDSYHEAVYVRSTTGITYPPVPALNFIGASTTSLWESKEVPSASGSTSYSVTVRVNSGTGNGRKRFNSESMVAAVVPYVQKDGNYVDPFAETVEKTTSVSEVLELVVTTLVVPGMKLDTAELRKTLHLGQKCDLLCAFQRTQRLVSRQTKRSGI